MATIKHVKAGDEVVVLSGKERGKTGTVMQVLPDKNAVLVENLNVVQRHQRQTSQDQPAGIVEKEAPIHASNVQLICPDTGEPTRVGRTYDEEQEQWVRISKKSGEIID